MSNSYTAALDVGERRIGVAVANNTTKFATPLATLQHDENFVELLGSLIKEHDIGILVVGMPRGMDGQETAQTRYTQRFADKIKASLQVPVYMQDEAGTSAQAKQELDTKGKPYDKEAVDALAATYILQDFMDTRLEEALRRGAHE